MKIKPVTTPAGSLVTIRDVAVWTSEGTISAELAEFYFTALLVHNIETHKSFATQVVEFNKTILGIDQRLPSCMPLSEEQITVKCLNEEVEEYSLAIAECDYVGQIDALIDLMYFGMGALYKLGLTPVQIEACCTAVHEANMTKKRGTNAKRDTGAADAVKGSDWVAPEDRIRSIVSESRK